MHQFSSKRFQASPPSTDRDPEQNGDCKMTGAGVLQQRRRGHCCPVVRGLQVLHTYSPNITFALYLSIRR